MLQNSFSHLKVLLPVSGRLSNIKHRGRKVGLLERLFGCGHRLMSRPFSWGDFGYSVCIDCGARRGFNPKTLRSFGGFYFIEIEKANFQADSFL